VGEIITGLKCLPISLANLMAAEENWSFGIL